MTIAAIQQAIRSNRVPVALVLLVVVLLVFAVARESKYALQDSLALPSIDDCVDGRLHEIKDRYVSFDSANRSLDHCYRRILSQGWLRDLEIRKRKFLQQQFADVVLLWMVVGITASGVVLAWLQLRNSFRYTRRPISTSEATPHELTVRDGSVVVKTSYVGLAILAVSLGFFLVFVIYVYPLTFVHTSEDMVKGQASPPPQVSRDAAESVQAPRGPSATAASRYLGQGAVIDAVGPSQERPSK